MSRHILITGATKGIGRACAEWFAEQGWSVTAIARTGADLVAMRSQWQQRWPATELVTVAADLSSPSGVATVPALAYDVVLLNAAAFKPGRLLDDGDTFAELLDLNVMGNHRLARRLLPALRTRGTGHLIVIGSTGTDHWKGHMTAYVATKFALRGLYYGWEQDLKGSGVLTTLVAPGATLTASWDNEIPPPDILAPAQVAEVVWQVIERGFTGRIIVER
ncbi:MAG: SDR family oxidoreductase [Bacteroidota bacterium]